MASLSNCTSAPSLRLPKPAAPQSLNISWQEEPNGRLSLSKADAVKLEQWLIDVEYYINN